MNPTLLRSAIAAAGLVVALAFSSCITSDVIAKAEGNPPTLRSVQRSYQPEPPQPAYWLLVPLTIPIDVITLPGQFIYFQTREDY